MAIVGIGLVSLAGCGGAVERQPAAVASSTRTQAPRVLSGPSPPRLSEVLAIPPVGRFLGRCAPAARRWTLRFVADKTINDFVSFRLGRRPRRTVNLHPGQVLTWRLRPRAFRSREPGFRQVPGDPASRSSARVTYLTTTPLSIVISQDSEPHILRVDARIALAAATGDTTNCAPIDTHLSAFTYFNGGQPTS